MSPDRTGYFSNRSKQRKISLASPLKNQAFISRQFPPTAQKNSNEQLVPAASHASQQVMCAHHQAKDWHHSATSQSDLFSGWLVGRG
jgi:hypothetical protein